MGAGVAVGHYMGNERIHSTIARQRLYGRLAVVGALTALTLLVPVLGQADRAHGAAGCANANKLARTISTGQAEKAVRCLVNKKRARRGLRAVRNSKQLAKAAERHSRYMRDNRCFAHRCNGGPDLATRLERSGYLPCGCTYSYGEAISWSYGSSATPKRTVTAWMKSPSHKKILMHRKFREIGIGTVWGSPHGATDDAAIYTADLGFRR